jgi:hypothetical protein
MAKITIDLKDNLLNRKDINHIVRYCGKLEYVINNLTIKGFQPSYCKETFNNENILIPMVSFCNIPLREVENYMYYGDYGIGFTIEWAIKNKISPVMYVHENSNVIKLSKNLKKDLMLLNAETNMNSLIKNIALNHTITDTNSDLFFTKESLKEISRNNIKIIQNSKPWKEKINFEIKIVSSAGEDCIMYEEVLINCYNEREWRFVPEFEDNEFLDIIYEKNPDAEDEIDTNYTKYKSLEKPHLKDDKHKLAFDLQDIKYIIVKEQNEVEKVTETLKDTFGESIVNDCLIKGKLQIISKESLKTDF